ncbi:hypothetical protein [Rhodoferax ferrireducens]|jgi:hypothetical protein|nr:hypothetical protein [Rhodoferax ferrireducens]WPC67330.1 hypothetical protein SBP18_02185 [Rhodoferax ferrireducens]
MSTLHFPKSFEHFSGSIKKTDPAAWVVLALAIASLAVLYAVIYFR